MTAPWKEPTVALDPQLLEILACPDTHHAPLDYDAQAQTLTCTECGRVFPVQDDIPVLLLDEASEPSPSWRAGHEDREDA